MASSTSPPPQKNGENPYFSVIRVAFSAHYSRYLLTPASPPDYATQPSQCKIVLQFVLSPLSLCLLLSLLGAQQN